MTALVSLEGRGGRRPHELSGGQRQRVAFGARTVEPEVLLLDEPLGALDLKLPRTMRDELKVIQQRVGTTFVHVTNDREEVMESADRIVVMNAGQIAEQGPPRHVHLSPKSFFSAGCTGLSCTNPMRDSSGESSVAAVRHEQTHTPRLQDHELAGLQ